VRKKVRIFFLNVRENPLPEEPIFYICKSVIAGIVEGMAAGCHGAEKLFGGMAPAAISFN